MSAATGTKIRTQSWLRDIGLPLVSVNRVEPDPQTPPTTPYLKHQGD
jgi:hypothetical protein